MMNYIRSFFRNEKFIFEIICIIIFIIFFLHVLNDQAAKSSKTTNENTNITTQEEFLEEDITYAKGLIENFITLCKNKNYEEAYKLLTDDCKNTIYTNQTEFINEYCAKYLIGLDRYYLNVIKLEQNNVVYNIQYYPDALETGKTAAETDFITVNIDKNDINNSKLNIASFVSNENIQKEYEDESIKIVINKKNIFKNYENYEVEFINKTDRTIEVDYQNIRFLNDQSSIMRPEYEETTNKIEITPKENTKKNIKINRDINNNFKILEINFDNIKINGFNKNIKINLD